VDKLSSHLQPVHCDLFHIKDQGKALDLQGGKANEKGCRLVLYIKKHLPHMTVLVYAVTSIVSIRPSAL
jgi:hypothetical protein